MSVAPYTVRDAGASIRPSLYLFYLFCYCFRSCNEETVLMRRNPLFLSLAVVFQAVSVSAAVLYSGGQWDFEAGFQQIQVFDRIGHVGNGWSWWSERLAYNGQFYGFGSINENKNLDNVSRGLRSQEITMTCATGWAGIYRTAAVPAGHAIRITYDARTTWSEFNVVIYTGINLTGGSDYARDSTTTSWEPWGGQPGPFVKVSRTVVSTGPQMTFFIAMIHTYPSCTGATFMVDNVEVFDDGPAVATATPTHTLTPSPTPTHTPSATATPTVAPPADADGDGITDELEGFPPAPGQTSRYLPDSDGDGRRDGQEDANRNGRRDAGETDARHRDSDGDGLEDGMEAFLGTNPLDAGSPAAYVDYDGDNLPAGADLDDANPDSDGDRFQDGLEVQWADLNAAYNPAVFPPLGDLNLDRALTNTDALIAQSIFLGVISPTVFATGNGDLNRDGFVSNVDALLIQSYFLTLLARLPF